MSRIPIRDYLFRLSGNRFLSSLVSLAGAASMMTLRLRVLTAERMLGSFRCADSGRAFDLSVSLFDVWT